ncbi:MAG: YlxR family protein [Chloroflexi bacterium]|nr:YlxR family protein [Chloroflexota bacterium]
MSCRTSRDKRALLRVVRTPAGSVMLDPTGRANGRGAYVCRADSCIERAVTKGGLGRALEVPIPETLETELRTAAGLADEPADNQED